jgi:hypothetical protein
MGIKCAFCGAEQKEVKFVIGAKGPDNQDDDMYCMVEGTGKMACPDCYADASKEGAEVIDNYINRHNARADGSVKLSSLEEAEIKKLLERG